MAIIRNHRAIREKCYRAGKGKKLKQGNMARVLGNSRLMGRENTANKAEKEGRQGIWNMTKKAEKGKGQEGEE